jgi:hypothetical protein
LVDAQNMKSDSRNVADMRQAREPWSMELLMSTAIVGFHLSEQAAPLNANADAVSEKSATAKQKSEFLKRLAAAGF